MYAERSDTSLQFHLLINHLLYGADEQLVERIILSLKRRG